jgi:hypothetical protein
MRELGFTPEEFRHIVRACERVLVHSSHLEVDLKPFLLTHLGSTSPELAARIAALGEKEMAILREELLTACQADAESALWQP